MSAHAAVLPLSFPGKHHRSARRVGGSCSARQTNPRGVSASAARPLQPARAYWEEGSAGCFL